MNDVLMKQNVLILLFCCKLFMTYLRSQMVVKVFTHITRGLVLPVYIA